jgi:hypothetical protein
MLMHDIGMVNRNQVRYEDIRDGNFVQLLLWLCGRCNGQEQDQDHMQIGKLDFVLKS